jgi:hypothetical protein
MHLGTILLAFPKSQGVKAFVKGVNVLESFLFLFNNSEA